MLFLNFELKRKSHLAFTFLVLLSFFILGGCLSETDELGDDDDNSASAEEASDNESDSEDATSNNDADHEESGDYTWSSADVEAITLSNNTITENSNGASANGTTITISAAGNYSFSGTLNDGQIIVNAGDDDLVRLILNNADITCSNSAPIYIKNADKVIVVANENTENSLTDGSSYVYDNEEDEEPNATLFSKTDLTVYGKGKLTIDANFNDGINGRDGIITDIEELKITAADEGILGKDYLIIKEGNYTIDAGGDGLKSNNEDDETRGYIEIISGNFDISAEGDGMSAYTDMIIEDGTFDIVTSGNVTSSNDASSKGIKSGVNTIIDGGTFNIKTTEDAIHSDQTITIHDGDFTISASDDGIHANYDLTINSGDYDITKSYEGIESSSGNLYINGGNYDIVSSDDGLNIAGGGESSGGQGGHGGGMKSASSGNYTMYLNPDYMAIYATGDGIDANGSVETTGGTIIIHGPTNSGNGIIDYDNSFLQNGGTLIAAGSSGMLQTPGSSSEQNCISITFRSSKSAGTLCHLQKSDGTSLFTFKPAKSFQAIIFSSPNIEKSSTYDFYTGGSASGSVTNGLYSGETYSEGTLQKSFTVSKTITSVSIN